MYRCRRGSQFCRGRRRCTGRCCTRRCCAGRRSARVGKCNNLRFCQCIIKQRHLVNRAKERIFVVSSIEPEDLNVSGSTHRGPQLLRRYLEYARAVSSQAVDTRDAVLRHVNPALDVRVEKTGQFDSPLEEQVYDELTRRNLVVKPQVGVSGYRIDLGVLDPSNPSRYLLGIECDGATYHSARSVRERDAYRQRFLESRGWIIHRIWSRNWWRNRSAEMDSLMEAIAKAKNAAPADNTADELGYRKEAHQLLPRGKSSLAGAETATLEVRAW